MKKVIFTPLIVLLLIAVPVFSQDDEVEPTPTLNNSTYHVGFRLGSWVNNGATHPTELADTNTSIKTSISDANFFAEGYFGYKLSSAFYTELSFGMSNRGTVEIVDQGFYDLSNLIIYPILLQLKFYPLGNTTSKIQPFVSGGGGLYYGRNSIQLTNDYYYQYRTDQGESATDFNYTLAGGFDYILSNSLSLELHGRYLPINFSKYLLFVDDYNATTITVGLKYRYNSKK